MKRLRVIDCAYDAGVSDQTVRTWIRQGKLQAVDGTIGHRRYEIEPDVWEEFCEKHGIERGKRPYVRG